MASAGLKQLTSSAISMVVAGNTGVTPFLTLLIVGLLERADPELLNMQGRLEEYLASDVGIALLAMVTVLELLSKCIPVVDELVDSGMTFIIPILSAVASASTFGLFLPNGDNNNDESSSSSPNEERLLKGGAVSWIGPLQIFLIIIGIVLALSLHFFKMIVRLIGEGWLTGCLAVMETIWTTTTIFIVVFIQPVAIALAIVICGVAAFAMYRVVLRIQKRRVHASGPATANVTPQQSGGAECWKWRHRDCCEHFCFGCHGP
jgi:Domain of unknown function (DUF4126)